MTKLYNTQENITRGFKELLELATPNIRKTQLKIIPSIIFGLINAESIVSSDIAKVLKDDFCNVQFSSTIKRINRFFNNKLFNTYYF